jgi:P4 family phage/plasmid primase-like protien
MQTIQFAKIMKATDYETIDAVDYRQTCKHGSGYEYIPDDILVKLYFDIDVKLRVADINDTADDITEVSNFVKTDITTVLKHILGEHYNEDQIFWGSSHGVLNKEEKIKVSYHVVINNIIAYKWAQGIIVQELNRSVFTILDDVEYYPKGMFDESVYKPRNQIIRSPYTSKPNGTFEGERPIKIESGTFEMSCISAFIPEDTMIWEREKPVRATTSPGATAPDAEGTTAGCPINRQIIEGIMPFLKPYAGQGQYKPWTTVIWGIKNITDDRNLGITFSRLDMTAFDETSFDNIWDNAEIRNKGVGIGTLISLAMKTDKEGTKQVLRKIENAVQKDTIREQGLKQLQNAVANAKSDKHILFDKFEKLTKCFRTGSRAEFFAELYKGKFIYVKESLYRYTGVYWEEDDKNYSALSLFINKYFVADLIEFCNYYISKYHKLMSETTNETEAQMYKDTIGLLSDRIITALDLKSIKWRKEQIADIIIHITDNTIKFNKKHHLFAFKNAVFDLKRNVEIKPDPFDYISMYADYDYDHKYDKNCIAEIQKLINSVHQDKQIRDYYCSVISTGLCGEHLQYFFVYTGKGSNGKSTLDGLTLKMLSNYGYNANVELLTGDMKSGPNPEVANMDQKRYVICAEPKEDVSFKMSNIKRITGDDEINARQLYSKKTDCKMNHTIAVSANTIPKTDEVNGAVMRRFRVIPFLTTAMDQEDYDMVEDKKNLCVKNRHYEKEEFKNSHRQALFEILRPFVADYYSRMDVLPVPEICKKASINHLAISDDIYEWIRDNYEEDTSAEPVKFKALFEIFKTTEAYYSLTKAQKRKYNLSHFCNKIESSPFLSRSVKLRKQYHNKIQLDSDCLVGWKLKENGTLLPPADEKDDGVAESK